MHEKNVGAKSRDTGIAFNKSFVEELVNSSTLDAGQIRVNSSSVPPSTSISPLVPDSPLILVAQSSVVASLSAVASSVSGYMSTSNRLSIKRKPIEQSKNSIISKITSGLNSLVNKTRSLSEDFGYIIPKKKLIIHERFKKLNFKF